MKKGEIDSLSVRVPAEWEPYDSVMVAWPHQSTDWAPMLDEVEECYINMVRGIVACGLRVLVVTPYPGHVRSILSDVNTERLLIFSCDTNDTWTRDYGVISAYDKNGAPIAIDFRFDGWGLKFASNYDNLVTLRMFEKGLLTRNYVSRLDYTFEGGSMEVDGAGTMLSTSHCLMALNRNGYRSVEDLECYFRDSLGIKRFLLLEHGHLEGDDTDSHIDTLARFAPCDTILYVKCYDTSDSHYRELAMMEEELKAFRTAAGDPYNLVGLPLPDAVYDDDGYRLPATYANFLITPGYVLMPTYRQPGNDLLAKQMIQVAFPDREVVGIDCMALIKQHGSLHCATMQLPEGIIKV